MSSLSIILWDFYLVDGALAGGDDNPHFDLARPDNPDILNIDEEKVADIEIKKLAELLIAKGVK